MTEQEQPPKVASAKRCPVCNADDLTKPFEEVEAVCGGCGAVIYDWNNQSMEMESKKYDPPKGPKEVSWSEVRPAHNSTQYRFSTAIEVIEEIATELLIPEAIRINAAELYVDAAVKDITLGRKITTVAAGTVYTAGKIAGEPRTLKRIADAAGIEQPALNKAVRCLHSELLEDVDHRETVAAPEDYIEFLCTDLVLDGEVPDRAECLLAGLQEQIVFDGKHPAGIAAAAVYIVDTSPPSQRKLAAAAGISTETLRKRLNELRAAKEQDNV